MISQGYYHESLNVGAPDKGAEENFYRDAEGTDLEKYGVESAADFEERDTFDWDIPAFEVSYIAFVLEEYIGFLVSSFHNDHPSCFFLVFFL